MAGRAGAVRTDASIFLRPRPVVASARVMGRRRTTSLAGRRRAFPISIAARSRPAEIAIPLAVARFPRGSRWTILFRRQLAVGVLVELLERRRGVIELGGRNLAVVIRVEGGFQRGRRRTPAVARRRRGRGRRASVLRRRRSPFVARRGAVLKTSCGRLRARHHSERRNRHRNDGKSGVFSQAFHVVLRKQNSLTADISKASGRRLPLLDSPGQV